MYLTITDTRTLSVAVVQSGTGNYFNWTTGALETPFVAANHLKPFAIIPNQPTQFSNSLQTVFLGSILLERQDVAPVVCTVDNTGAPIAVVDVPGLPSPIGAPTFFAFTK